jgi:hypothetical protein
VTIAMLQTVVPATAGRKPVVDANGLVDANAVKVGPTGSGTAQTARDIGASVLVGGSVAGQDDAVRRGTAQAGAAGSITLDASASATDSLYQWQLISILSATGVGQTRLITGYTGSTKVATVAPNWTTNPDSTSLFAIFPFGRANIGYLLETIFSTPATAGIPDVNVKNMGGSAGTFASGRPEVNTTHWRGTAAPAEDTAGYPKVTIKDGTGVGEIDTNAGAIVTVTNLTNAPSDSSGVTTLLSRLSAARAAMLDALSLRTGTAQAGAAGTITLDSGASATNDLYKGQWVAITSGTGAGQVRLISGYVGSTKVASVHGNWATNPDNTSVFYLLSAADINGLVLADTVTTLTNAPSDSSGVTSLLSRLTTTRAGYLDNLSAGAVATASALTSAAADITTLLGRIPAALFSGITSLAQWLGLIAGKQTGNSTARTELRATGAGSGTYDETTDAQEAIRDNMGTAQTGDSYARLGAPAGASVSADVAAVKSDTGTILTAVDTEVAAIKAKTDNLPSDPADASDIATAFAAVPAAVWANGTRTLTGSQGIKKNTAKAAFPFQMTDSTNHNPATGLTVTAQRSLDGAAFAACANSVVELSNGIYTIDLAAGDLNGDTVFFKFTATGADQLGIAIVTSP